MNKVGSINEKINEIYFDFRTTGKQSESLIRYYNLIDQPPTVVRFWTKEMEEIPFTTNLYFGCFSDRLKMPFVFWNGFYIQPFKIENLNYYISEGRIFHQGKIATDINEFKDYILAYRDGFFLGYENFNTKIDDELSGLKTDKRYIEKIIRYVDLNKNVALSGLPFSSHCNTKKVCPFRTNIEIKEFKNFNNSKIFKEYHCKCKLLPDYNINLEPPCVTSTTLFSLPQINDWKSKGFENGQYYRAWFFILSNYQIFDEYFAEQAPQKTITKLPQFIQTNLTTDKRALLFKLLVKADLITNTTDPDCFNWALKVIDEEQNKQPEKWKKIQWKKAKHGLRILLTPILGTISNQHIRDIENLFDDENAHPLKMGKDEYRFPPEYHDKIEPILKSLNFERAKWYTGEKKPTSPTSE